MKPEIPKFHETFNPILDFPDSMSPKYQPMNKGTPTAIPATTGKCHFRVVLLNWKKPFILYSFWL